MHSSLGESYFQGRQPQNRMKAQAKTVDTVYIHTWMLATEISQCSGRVQRNMKRFDKAVTVLPCRSETVFTKINLCIISRFNCTVEEIRDENEMEEEKYHRKYAQNVGFLKSVPKRY